MGGTKLNCTIAIDFTGRLINSTHNSLYSYQIRFVPILNNTNKLPAASNGHPNTVGSLHYMGPSPTLYEQALLSVVSIIQDYDSDKQFPVLGFGAKLPPDGILSHEFFVNLTSSPFCAGVEGYYQFGDNLIIYNIQFLMNYT